MNMLPQEPQDILEGGFCCQTREVTVDTGPRIRLPQAMVRTLQHNAVTELWIYPDPTGPRLILCPAQYRERYITVARANLPGTMSLEEAFRRFICTGEQVSLRHHGRISIAPRYPTDFTVAVGEQVVIVGTGRWYELWREDDWLSMGGGSTE